MSDSNAVHSYYNNQPAKRVVQDLLDDAVGLQVVEIRINGAKPVLAILTSEYAEKRTDDVVALTAVSGKKS